MNALDDGRQRASQGAILRGGRGDHLAPGGAGLRALRERPLHDVDHHRVDLREQKVDGKRCAARSAGRFAVRFQKRHDVAFAGLLRGLKDLRESLAVGTGERPDGAGRLREQGTARRRAVR